MKVFVESFHVPGEAAAKTWIKWLIQYFSNWIKINNGLDKLLTIVLKNPTINEKVKRHQYFIFMTSYSKVQDIKCQQQQYMRSNICVGLYMFWLPQHPGVSECEGGGGWSGDRLSTISFVHFYNSDINAPQYQIAPFPCYLLNTVYGRFG